MQPVVCNKDMAVVFPLKDGDCEFWLEIVDSVDDITNPSRDHAYVDSKGLFYIYNGKEIQVINDHANLKIKWGNMIGDISNQLDLMEIINQFVKTISVNGTNIAKDNEKNIAIQVPITTIKLDGNTISPVDYIVNLDLASVYAKKTEIPKNVSELENDAGYIKQEVVDQLIPIKAIKVNDVTIQPDETHTVNIETGYVTPEMFGAVGDGVTDDSTAFNACIKKAKETHKCILLQTKPYFIQNKLINISNIKFIGSNSAIIIANNLLCNNIQYCSFSNITFIQDSTLKNQITLLTNYCVESNFKNCDFTNFTFLFNRIETSSHSNMILLDSCYLNNTSLSNQPVKEDKFVINNTNFYYDDGFNNNFLVGLLGGTIVFNNCYIVSSENKNAFIKLYGNVIFNNCYIYLDDNNMIMIPNDIDITNINIEFNNCGIRDISIEKTGVLVNIQLANSVLPTLKVKNTSISIKTIFNSDVECSLWLENNIMDTKPIINIGTGKVNLVEIQQKYSDTSENIFPWTTETPTVENNVSLVKVGTTDYYVLTENEDKTIKKVDYYFKYTQPYTKGAPYYNTGKTLNGLDLTGYELKTYMLKNNIFKLKDSNGDLIDYVYFDLNSADISGGTEGAINYTMVNMQFIPAVTKWTGKEEANGNVEFNTCITLILEKTSS